MIILSNALKEKCDEGALKVANSLTKRLKNEYPDNMVISYGYKPRYSDLHLSINKLLLNWTLISLIREKKEKVLYIPFPARIFFTSLRIWILSCFAKYGLQVILIQRPEGKADKVSVFLLKHSKAKIITLSQDSYHYYNEIIGDRVEYLKAGVDLNKFKPVTKPEKEVLRTKYGIDVNAKVILHVGHLSDGRNLKEMLKLDLGYHLCIVLSTFTAAERNMQLYRDFQSRGNITIIGEYVPKIEEIYQLADVYFFPVEAIGNCIDVPLSCLEAAACNIPVITTAYGEMKQFMKKNGFYYIRDFDTITLNTTLNNAFQDAFQGVNSREAVLDYDWNLAVDKLVQNVEKDTYE